MLHTNTRPRPAEKAAIAVQTKHATSMPHGTHTSGSYVSKGTDHMSPRLISSIGARQGGEGGQKQVTQQSLYAPVADKVNMVSAFPFIHTTQISHSLSYPKRTNLECPYCAARCSGVSPVLEAALGSACLISNTRAASY